MICIVLCSFVNINGHLHPSPFLASVGVYELVCWGVAYVVEDYDDDDDDDDDNDISDNDNAGDDCDGGDHISGDWAKQTIVRKVWPQSEGGGGKVAKPGVSI